MCKLHALFCPICRSHPGRIGNTQNIGRYPSPPSFRPGRELRKYHYAAQVNLLSSRDHHRDRIRWSVSHLRLSLSGSIRIVAAECTSLFLCGTSECWTVQLSKISGKLHRFSLTWCGRLVLRSLKLFEKLFLWDLEWAERFVDMKKALDYRLG